MSSVIGEARKVYGENARSKRPFDIENDGVAKVLLHMATAETTLPIVVRQKLLKEVSKYR